MELFAKKIKVYEAKGRKQEWKRVRAALKEAGVRKISANIWQDEPPVCGCGAHLDNRDFGPNGRIDRNIYSIYVLEDDKAQAERLISEILPEYKPYVSRKDRIRFT